MTDARAAAVRRGVSRRAMLAALVPALRAAVQRALRIAVNEKIAIGAPVATAPENDAEARWVALALTLAAAFPAAVGLLQLQSNRDALLDQVQRLQKFSILY